MAKIKIAALRLFPVDGIRFFRQLQPLMTLERFYPDKVQIVYGNMDNIAEIAVGADIYFHASPGYMLMDKFCDILREYAPKVKIVFDYDDAPDRFIGPDIPAYRDYGTEEAEINFGSLIARNGEKIEFKRIWKNDNFYNGIRFNTSANIKHIMDANAIKSKADFITTTTPRLAELMRNMVSCPVEILPNFIEPSMYAKVPDSDRTPGEVRIAWVIGQSHVADMYHLMPSLVDLLNERKNVKVYLMSQYNDEIINMVKHIDVPADRFIVFPATGIVNGYFDVLRNMDIDIGLMHLKESTEFNRCKSPLKFLEMTACGAAALAPDTLYSDYIENEYSGLLYANINEFNALIRRLIDDAGLRHKLNINAMKEIKPYTAREVAPKYMEFFEKIMVTK